MKFLSLLYFHPILTAHPVRSFHMRFANIQRAGRYISSRSASTNLRDIPVSLSSSLPQCRQQYSSFSLRLFSTTNEDEDPTEREAGKKRVVFLGTPEVAATTLRELHQDSIKPKNNNESYEIVCVITQPPKRRRRKGDKAEPSPVGRVAEELGILVLSPEKMKDSDFLDSLEQSINPDLCITAAYGQYLPKRFLAAPTLGTVNIHPSLLPRWRGASPVQRSLEAGDNPVGVTVLYTVSKMDAGPIIAQKEESIVDKNIEDATATKVLPWLFEIGTDLLIEKLPDILSGAVKFDTAKIQDESQVVQAAMIDSSEAEMKPWEETATTLHNRLNGFSMWPGCFMYLEVGKGTKPVKFKILKTRLLEEKTERTDIVEAGPSKKDGLRLVCFDGSILEINSLQPATKKPVDSLSFVNGLQGRTVRYVKTPEEVVAV